MKRNSNYLFVVLFILSACTPSLGGQGQVATSTQEATAKTEQGENIETNSSPYPTTSENFILDPSNKEKKEKIEAVAAEDLHRQENLYIEEIKRGGIEGVGINDIEFTYNISSGGWIVLPTTSKFPKYIYIPTVEGVVQSSLDLNRHLLDWDPKEDNFDLVRVKMNEPTVIFDKSNWSVVAHMNKENQVDKWYYPPTDTIITEKLKPEAAPYKINANFPMMGYEGLAENYEFFAKQFSNVTLEEDILSGKL